MEWDLSGERQGLVKYWWGCDGARGRGHDGEDDGGGGTLGATPSMVDSTSAELLRIAQDGGLAKNVRYTYKGKLVKFFRVTGNDYAKAVGEFRTQRKHGRRQIGLRVCQLVAFVVTVLTIAIATWYLTLAFDEIQLGSWTRLFLWRNSSGPPSRAPSPPRKRWGVHRLRQAHLVSLNIPPTGGGHFQKGVDTAGEVVDGGPKVDGRHQLQRNSRVRERRGQKCDERGESR